MDDLVKRKDVADAVKDYWKAQIDKCLTDIDIKYSKSVSTAILEHNSGILERIYKLPSVHPEVIQCKDCRYSRNCELQDIAHLGELFYCGLAERRKDG